MRILIIHNQLWAHYKATVFNELHRIASNQDATVHVIHIAEVEKSRQSMGDSSTDIHQYSYEVLFGGALEEVSFLPKLAKLLERVTAFAPDVVNVTGYYDPATWALLLYCQLRGIPVVMSNESTLQDQTRRGFKERFKRWLVGQYDGFFCFGTKAAEYMMALGVLPDKILTKNAAVVDNDEIKAIFEANQSRAFAHKQALGLPTYNFIFVGRLVGVKNLPFLLSAFRAAQVFAPDWGLILIGDGDLKASLQTQIQQQQIERVYFAGGHSWQKIPEWLTLGDIFVISSTSETWGLVVNEAMVCGLPVLVSSWCGCAVDLVEEGVNGYTFNPTKQADLEHKLRWFIENTAQFQPMGMASQRIIQRFAPATAAHDMFEAFKKLSQKSTRPA
ncbi:MAG: glycosyltransferase family 4 protein [Spirosomataceae bacterium]